MRWQLLFTTFVLFFDLQFFELSSFFNSSFVIFYFFYGHLLSFLEILFLFHLAFICKTINIVFLEFYLLEPDHIIFYLILYFNRGIYDMGPSLKNYFMVFVLLLTSLALRPLFLLSFLFLYIYIFSHIFFIYFNFSIFLPYLFFFIKFFVILIFGLLVKFGILISVIIFNYFGEFYEFYSYILPNSFNFYFNEKYFKVFFFPQFFYYLSLSLNVFFSFISIFILSQFKLIINFFDFIDEILNFYSLLKEYYFKSPIGNFKNFSIYTIFDTLPFGFRRFLIFYIYDFINFIYINLYCELTNFHFKPFLFIYRMFALSSYITFYDFAIELTTFIRHENRRIELHSVLEKVHYVSMAIMLFLSRVKFFCYTTLDFLGYFFSIFFPFFNKFYFSIKFNLYPIFILHEYFFGLLIDFVYSYVQWLIGMFRSLGYGYVLNEAQMPKSFNLAMEVPVSEIEDSVDNLSPKIAPMMAINDYSIGTYGRLVFRHILTHPIIVFYGIIFWMEHILAYLFDQLFNYYFTVTYINHVYMLPYFFSSDFFIIFNNFKFFLHIISDYFFLFFLYFQFYIIQFFNFIFFDIFCLPISFGIFFVGCGIFCLDLVLSLVSLFYEIIQLNYEYIYTALFQDNFFIVAFFASLVIKFEFLTRITFSQNYFNFEYLYYFSIFSCITYFFIILFIYNIFFFQILRLFVIYYNFFRLTGLGIELEELFGANNKKFNRMFFKLYYHEILKKNVKVLSLSKIRQPNNIFHKFYQEWGTGGHNEFRTEELRIFYTKQINYIRFYQNLLDYKSYMKNFLNDKIFFYHSLDYIKHIRYTFFRILFSYQRLYNLFYYKTFFFYGLAFNTRWVTTKRFYTNWFKPSHYNFIKSYYIPVLFIFDHLRFTSLSRKKIHLKKLSLPTFRTRYKSFDLKFFYKISLSTISNFCWQCYYLSVTTSLLISLLVKNLFFFIILKIKNF